MNHFGKLHRISLILNIMFLILMPKIYSFDNIYLSIIWTLLGIANAVYLLIKQRQEFTYYDVHSRSWTKIYLYGVFFMIEYDKFDFKIKVFQEY